MVPAEARAAAKAIEELHEVRERGCRRGVKRIRRD
jgi:hypothetical protein